MSWYLQHFLSQHNGLPSLVDGRSATAPSTHDQRLEVGAGLLPVSPVRDDVPAPGLGASEDDPPLPQSDRLLEAAIKAHGGSSVPFHVVSSLLLAGATVLPRYLKEQLAARFYYDLGPAQVDVTAYPKEQQANYAVFEKTCSQCHSPSRPLIAPFVIERDWKRYVQRMHLHTKVRAGTSITKEQAKAIVDFLVFDARLRKVDRKEQFEATAKNLQALFKDIENERNRLQAEENMRNVKPLPLDGSGAHPQP